MKIDGEMHCLRRAVDHECRVLESFVTKNRDSVAALTFLKKTLKRHGSPQAITTDVLASYWAAMKDLGNTKTQEIGRWANNRVDNSHLPIRELKRAMLRFQQVKSLQKFASVHANFHHQFKHKRHLVSHQEYKSRRSAALAEWQSLMAKPFTDRESSAWIGDEFALDRQHRQNDG